MRKSRKVDGLRGDMGGRGNEELGIAMRNGMGREGSRVSLLAQGGREG